MSDINLLQATKTEADNSGRNYRVLNIIGIVLFVLAFGAAVIVYLAGSSAAKHKAALNDQVAQGRAGIESIQAYPILLSDQTKIKNLKLLLDHHVDWSRVLPAFFSVTLKSAAFTKFTGNNQGSVTIAGVVPNFQELDKLMQALQLEDATGQTFVNDVNLLNVGLSTDSDSTVNGVSFTINVTFDKTLLKPLSSPVNPVPVNIPSGATGQSNVQPDQTQQPQ